MKIFKKIAFLQIFALSLILFSCASTPKTEEKFLETDISSEEIPEPENSLQNENNGISQESELSEDADSPSEQKQDFSDLTEPLTQEQNPDLPELPELEEATEINGSTDEPSSILEPQAKDEPSDEKNENQTSLNQNESENENLPEEELIQNKQDILAEQNSSEQTENENQYSENRTDENENSETTDIDANIIEETENFQETDSSEQQEEIKKPSRSVTIKKNQNIDIVYPGKGWIYQGNIDENGNIDSRNKNFIFGGRKLGGKDTSFTLRSRNPGTYLLHFFKNDTLTGKYIDDFLEVTVQNEATDSAEHITAPDYAEVVPPKVSITAENSKNQQKKDNIGQNTVQTENTKNLAQKTEQKKSAETAKNAQGNSKNSEIDTIIQTTESAPGSSSPSVKTVSSALNNKNQRTNTTSQAEETVTSENSAAAQETSSSSLENLSQDSLLELAKKYYDEKKYQQAFSVISKFFDKATERLDEGLFLQGQILEEKSPVQNIKSAIESYDLVVNNYPASSLWDKANKRSIFLKRFYINIR